MKTGQLIVIEGTDGSGKTTQIELLSKYLKIKGVDFEVISFPQYGKNEYADYIHNYLSGKFGKIEEVDPYFIAKSYASDRQTARDLIKSWLDQGKLVITNRYVSSSKAHLAANLPKDKRKYFINWLERLEYQENRMPKEDLAILLLVDAKVGQENVQSKHNPDIHEDNLQHLIEANKIYQDLANAEPNWYIVDCMKDGEMRSREDIQEDLIEILEDKLK